MTNIIRTLSAAALAGGLAITLAASASAQQDRPPPPPGADAGQGQHWDQGQGRDRFEARREQRQKVLHDALGLRADQEGAWQAFITSSHRRDGERGPGMRRRDSAEGQRVEISTPERLDRMAQRMAERQSRFAQRADAIKRFYAALDPRQQKTFDALLAEGEGGMGGFGHHHHMGRGGAGGPGGPERGERSPDGERG